jgi:hypothetical protein
VGRGGQWAGQDGAHCIQSQFRASGTQIAALCCCRGATGMSSDYVSMRLSGSGLRYSQQPSFLQLLQSEVGLVTLLAGLLLAVYLYLNRQVQASRSAPRRCIDAVHAVVLPCMRSWWQRSSRLYV